MAAPGRPRASRGDFRIPWWLGRAGLARPHRGGCTLAASRPFAGWIPRIFSGAPPPEAPPIAAPERPGQVGGRMAVPSGPVAVRLESVPAGTVVDVRRAADGSVGVLAAAGSEFSYGEGEVRASIAAGPVTVELPEGVVPVTLTVNGGVYLVQNAAGTEVTGPSTVPGEESLATFRSRIERGRRGGGPAPRGRGVRPLRTGGPATRTRTPRRSAVVALMLGGSPALATAAAAGPVAAAAALQVPADAAGASVYGTVTGVFRGEESTLSYALLAVETPDGPRWVQANEDGRYLLDGLGPGAVTVRVRHPGFEPIAVQVILAADAAVRVDLELAGGRSASTRSRCARAAWGTAPRGTGTPQGNGTGLPRPIPELEIQALDLTPGVGDPALASAVRALPGNDPASATDVLYLRGSTADLKLVLLDGAPVYTPFHVAGLMPGFEPTLLGAAALHRGGAPARYDGGLTHILELRTRSPRRDRLRASGALDLLTASAAAEGPLGPRGGFLASARGLHDVGAGPLGAAGPTGIPISSSRPSTNGRGPANRRHRLPEFRGGSPRLRGRAGGRHLVEPALSVSYEGPVRGARVRALAAASEYDASLPLQPSTPGTESPPATLLATGANRRARLLAELEWGGPAARTSVGLSHNYIEAAYGARDPGAGVGTSTNATHTATGLHADAVRLLSPQVTLRSGVRRRPLPGRRGGDRTACAPLLGLRPARAPERGGRALPPAHRTPDVEVERTLQEVVSAELSAPQLLPVARADHLVVSLEQQFAGRVRLGVHGHWKSYRGLAAASGGAETTRSSGLDLRIGSAGESEVVWLGYGLSWFCPPATSRATAATSPAATSSPRGHRGELWGPVRGEFRVGYGAGLPHTAIPFRPSASSVRRTGRRAGARPSRDRRRPSGAAGHDRARFASPGRTRRRLSPDRLRAARPGSPPGGAATTGASARTCAC